MLFCAQERKLMHLAVTAVYHLSSPTINVVSRGHHERLRPLVTWLCQRHGTISTTVCVWISSGATKQFSWKTCKATGLPTFLCHHFLPQVV